MAPYTHGLPHHQHPHQRGTFVKVHEPALAQHCHPESIVYIRVRWTFYGFGQLCNDAVVSYTVFFTPLKILSSTHSSPTPGNHSSFYCLQFYFLPRCRIFGITEHRQACQGAFFHSVTGISGSCLPFRGLIGHFFLAPNNIPPPGWTTVYVTH